ncbi:MAG: terminase large subunit [Peptostreptococcaceae bacterium]|nr:terminase large subunit [Peptostreptococcaceae bacterium]
MILLDKAIQYAKDCIEGREITTWEVIEQCKKFLNDYNNRQYQDDFDYYFDKKKLKKIQAIIGLMRYATGFLTGELILPNLSNHQCFLFANIFGWRFKSNPKKFRYREALLFIARKNAKGTDCAIIIICFMLTEDDYSEVYSICVSKELAAEIRKQIDQLVNASPALKKHFKISKMWTGQVLCKLTKSFYQPRTAEANKNNSIRPGLIVADEVGSFTDASNINAMKSGQRSVLNPLLFRTTSAYAESNSIIYEELEYCRNILKGSIVNERYFCLIYYANNDEIWEDSGIYRANPLRIEENYQEIREARDKAKEVESEREEFLTKSLNIMLETSAEEEHYLDMNLWKKCRVEKINLKGKKVIVSVDLSKTIDLTAVGIMFREEDKYYAKVHGFIPEGTLNSAKRHEKIDYYAEMRKGNCTIIKGDNIKYIQICEYIRGIEEQYECEIECIAIDTTYADLLIEELEADYEIVALRQTYTVLSPPTLSMRDAIYEGRFFYEKNSLLDWNMSNALVSTGKAGDIMLMKHRASNNTRIDMAVVLPFGYSQLYLKPIEYDPIAALMSQDWSGR